MPTKISRFGKVSSLFIPFSIFQVYFVEIDAKMKACHRIYNKTTVPKGREDQVSIVSSNKHANGRNPAPPEGVVGSKIGTGYWPPLDNKNKNHTRLPGFEPQTSPMEQQRTSGGGSKWFGPAGIRTSDLTDITGECKEKCAFTVKLQARMLKDG
jgi:hypothetical protein